MPHRQCLTLVLPFLACSSTAPMARDASARDASAKDASAEASGAAACPALMAATSDAGDPRCRAQRYRLSCRSAGDGAAGLTMLCVSDDPNRCSGASATPGVEYTCSSVCAPNEYGVSCGGIGPTAPSPAPPNPACNSSGVTPGGIVFYCCPCSP